MHKYERYIIYPLLILALFYGLAGENVVSNAKNIYDEIIAKKITIVNDEGKKMVELEVSTKEDNIYNLNPNDSGIIRVYEDDSKKDSKKLTTITNKNVVIDYYESKEGFAPTESSSLYSYGVSVHNFKSGNFAEMKVNKRGGSTILLKNKTVKFNSGSEQQPYLNFIQLGINKILTNDREILFSVRPTISTYYKKITNKNMLFDNAPKSDEKRIDIAENIDILSPQNKSIIKLGNNSGNGGIIDVRNSHGNTVISLSQTAPDEHDQGQGHGLINIFDKYGEDFRSYSY